MKNTSSNIRQSSFGLRQLVFIILVALTNSSVLFSQTNGLSYSRYGIGDIDWFPNSRAAGMGGAGISTLPTGQVDDLNPANWAKLSLTRFSVSGLYRQMGVTDAAGAAQYGSAAFNGLMFALPLAPSHGLVFTLGLNPYSNVGYTITGLGSQSGYNYTLEHHGEGSTSKAQAGFSYNVATGLSAGLAYDYYFGALQHDLTQTLINTNYSSSDIIREVHLKGSGFTAGAVWSGFGNLFSVPAGSELHIGAFVSSASYLSADEERRTNSAVGSTGASDTLSSAGYKLKLPLRFGAGISYSVDRFTLASDFVTQNWDETKYPGTLTATVRNSYRWSLGGEVVPKVQTGLPFFQRLTYRLGTYYSATYYVINGQPINELGFTGGFSLPVLGDTKVDITLDYATRGTTDFQLQKDNILRLSLTLITGEVWFLRPPEE